MILIKNLPVKQMLYKIEDYKISKKFAIIVQKL